MRHYKNETKELKTEMRESRDKERSTETKRYKNEKWADSRQAI